MKITVSILVIMIVLLGLYGLFHMFGASALLNIVAVLVLLCGLFGWILPRVLKRVNTKVWIAIGLLILIGLIVPSSSLMADREPGPVSTLIRTTLLLLPPLALVNAATLLHSGLDAANKRSSIISLALSALLLVRTIYNLYELTLWDNTDDPLGYFWLILPVLAVLLSGVMLLVALPDRMKLAGPAYAILVSAVLIAVSAFAQRVDFRQETAKRAERTVRAIESYYARQGSYPERLSQLTPWYIVSLPKPMTIYGQDWCYESGEGYYRLGYLDREHWSDPRLMGRIYKSVGGIPDSQPICMDEFTAIQKRYPDYPYTYWKESE